MNIKELILLLSQYDENLPVCITDMHGTKSTVSNIESVNPTVFYNSELGKWDNGETIIIQ